jgi:hypothetical protein
MCIPLIIARPSLGKHVPEAKKAHAKPYCCMRRFLCGPCRIKRK